MGAISHKRWILTSSESIQQRIIVLAIAPAVIVPKSLCYKSRNYMSRRDFVTRLDIVGNLKYGDQLKILEPHPEAKIWDHEFVSPTFTKTLQYYIDDFFENYGGKK